MRNCQKIRRSKKKRLKRKLYDKDRKKLKN